MSNFLKPRTLFSAVFIVLLVTNIVILAGVAANRNGEPQVRLSLSERELNLPYRSHTEDSSLSLELVWRTLGEDDSRMASAWHPPSWFNAAKLKELGYGEEVTNPSIGTEWRESKALSKEVFIVLEYNGPAYQQSLRQAEASLAKAGTVFAQTDEETARKVKEAEARVASERDSASRLFAVDAGLNPLALHKKYSAQGRYIIARGLVKPYYRGAVGEQSYGSIIQLNVDKIAIPLAIRRELAKMANLNLPTSDRGAAPRFTIDLAYGSRYEPWIVAVGKAGMAN